MANYVVRPSPLASEKLRLTIRLFSRELRKINENVVEFFKFQVWILTQKKKKKKNPTNAVVNKTFKIIRHSGEIVMGNLGIKMPLLTECMES